MIQTRIEWNKPHIQENTPENDKNYLLNLNKFSKNCKIIFEQLMTGRAMTGKDCVRLDIMEYRRRFKDLKDVHGIPVQDDYVEGKQFKKWWLPMDFINNCGYK